MTTDRGLAHPEPIVRVRDLRVDGLFEGLSFDLGRGECLAIVDEHDLRRTALLQCIAALRRPDAGSIEAPRSQAVWHDDGLVDDEPVRQTIMSRVGIGADQVADLLEPLGLRHRVDHEPWAMSAGERRRVAVQLALSCDVPLVVLDEPERGLDKVSLEWLARRLREVCGAGMTVIMATHSEWLAKAAATIVADEL